MASVTGITPGVEPLVHVLMVGVIPPESTVILRSSMSPWVIGSTSFAPGTTVTLMTNSPPLAE